MQTDELIRRKKSLNVSNRKIAEDAELPIGTIQKIFSGETKNPRYDTMIQIDRILTYYEKIGEHRDYSDDHSERKRRSKSTRFWQFLRLETVLLFKEAIEKQFDDKQCTVWPGPCEVDLNDTLPSIYPDLFITDQMDPDPICFHGVPPMIMEICPLPEHTQDFISKLRRYGNAGIKEYWLLEPEERTVSVYRFGDHMQVEEFGLNEMIPLQWKKKMGYIDFGKLAEKIDRLFPSAMDGGE